jgi:hypothetical protein
MIFRPLSLNDRKLFDQYSDGGINFENNFAVLYVWSSVIKYEIAQLDDALIIKVDVDGKIIFDTPKTKNKFLDKYLDACRDYCIKNNKPFMMKILAKDFDNLSQETKEKYNFQLIPNQWDYIYSSSDLARFDGSKFQKKRNLYAQFIRKYKYSFVDFDKTKHYEKILNFQKQWNENKSPDNWEYNALKCALDNLSVLGLFCDIIEIDGQIAAFSVSNKPTSKAGEIIFEKGDVNYKGIYAAIVRFSVEKHFQDVEFINREEDMGLENIRRAKQGFNPIMQIKKYMATLKNEDDKRIR